MAESEKYYLQGHETSTQIIATFKLQNPIS